MKIRVLLISLFLILIGNQVNAQKKLNKKLKELDKYYAKSLKDWKVPGMAVAIVHDNKIIFEKGYGVKNINTEEKVDENTLFQIASNTKSFTTAALSILVSENKIKWDDPIQKYIPWFQLYNTYVSGNISIRDALSHRSGLVTFSGDLIWYGSKYNRKEVIRRARFLQPKFPFRTRFGYSNILYLTAGEIIPEVTGISWDEYIKTKIFAPLEMSRSITSEKDLLNKENVATPHHMIEGKPVVTHYINWDNIAPAGSIISSVHDISNWLIMHLNKGKYKGKEILKAEQIYEMQSPNTPIYLSEKSSKMFPSQHFKAYALGWQVFDYEGKKIVTHNGGADGMISQTVLIPELKIGFVILTNASSGLYYPNLYKTLDVILDKKNAPDWSKLILESKKAKSKLLTQKVDQEKLPMCLEQKDYIGVYGGDIYGNAKVSFIKKGNQNELYLELLPTPMFKGILKHISLNTFEIKFPEAPGLPSGTVNFLVNEKGIPYKIIIDIPNPDFNFKELELIRK
ncbi:MAG: serine hydrolase [Bacteroidales bacterium]